MKQSLLERAVALATGESISTIRHRGFDLDRTAQDDALPRPQTIDWDRVDANRLGYLPQRARPHRNVA